MKLVKVTWRDIRTLESGWKTAEECISEAQKLFNEDFITVGYLIHEGPDFVLVAATRDSDEETGFHDVSLILTSVIKQIEEL